MTDTIYLLLAFCGLTIVAAFVANSDSDSKPANNHNSNINIEVEEYNNEHGIYNDGNGE